LGPVGIISPNLSTWCAQGRHENLGTIFLGPAPLKFPVARLGAILDYFRLRSQISQERIEISTSGQRRYELQPSHVWRKNRVNLGPLTKEFICLISTHPRSTLSETIFRPLGGAAPSNFYTWLRMAKAC